MFTSTFIEAPIYQHLPFYGIITVVNWTIASLLGYTEQAEYVAEIMLHKSIITNSQNMTTEKCEKVK